MKSKTIINLLFLLSIFSISIIIRIDNLKDPMGRHHEWLTGHVLSTLVTYETDGAFEHYFAPVWTFNTEADRYIASFHAFKDKNNYTYYVSYPPMCFLLPHALFKVFGINASVVGMRVLGLIVHFLIGFIIYLLLLRMFKKTLKKDVFLPGIMGFCFYTFAAGNLWFHGHVWFADMLVPFFIISLMYVVYRTLEGSLTTERAVFFLFLISALGAYTEWQMLFLSFAICLVFFYKGFQKKKYFLFLVSIAIGSLLSVYITYCQYSNIAGSKAFLEVLKRKYEMRSGRHTETTGAGGIKNSISFENISANYEHNYSTLLYYGWFALVTFGVLLWFNRMLKNKVLNTKQMMVFVILLFSILIHHYVFFNFTAFHDFSTLKSSLLLSLFCGFVLAFYYKLFNVDSVKSKKIGFYVINLIFMALFVYFSTQNYYNAHEPSKIDKNNVIIGEIVNSNIKPNEVVFCNIEISPEATWYAKRNIITVIDFNDAKEALARINSKYKGVFIKLNPKNYELFKLTTKGDTLNHTTYDYGKLKCLQKLN